MALSHEVRGRVAEDPGDAGMGVLDVEDGVLRRLLRREVDVDLDRLVVPPRDEIPASRIDADLVDEVVEKDDVAAPFRHLRRLAALRQVHELVDQHLQRVARVAEHLGERLQPADVAVMVGAEDVDEPVEALRILPAHVGRIGGEIRRRAVGTDEDAVLLVAVCRRAGPQRRLLLVRVEERDRLRDLGLDDALALEGVELDPEPLERCFDQAQHPRHRVTLVPRERGDVVAVVAVLGRLLATADGLDRRAKAVHLPAGVVVVVLALDRVPGEREQPGDAVAVGAVPGRRDRHRARRVGGHHLDLHPLGGRGRAAAEVSAVLEHVRERFRRTSRRPARG